MRGRQWGSAMERNSRHDLIERIRHSSNILAAPLQHPLGCQSYDCQAGFVPRAVRVVVPVEQVVV